MEISKVKSAQQNQARSDKEGLLLPADELKKLTDFFSILMQIDQRIKKRGGKSNEQV